MWSRSSLKSGSRIFVKREKQNSLKEIWNQGNGLMSIFNRETKRNEEMEYQRLCWKFKLVNCYEYFMSGPNQIHVFGCRKTTLTFLKKSLQNLEDTSQTNT